MSCYYTQYLSDSALFRTHLMVNSKDGVYVAMLFTLRESRRTSDPALLRGSKSAKERWLTISPLDALALKPSGFCNVRVYSIFGYL